MHSKELRYLPTPVGPYKLSIHPLIGSLDVEVTIAGRKTPTGSPAHSFLTKSSARAFVSAEKINANVSHE